ncbi:DNA-binding CsgD family transcriptional regulator [Siphonobacter sp. SORGH_AS 1065]|nr:DNA-binding CsgD family transcriptional regulator [Siphonobacter sp. SORGH_AS_1065]
MTLPTALTKLCMNQTDAYTEARKFWKKATRYQDATDINLEFELTLHKKLLNIFHVGPYFYFIFNLTNGEIEYVSDSVTQVLGCNPEEFGVKHTLSHIHPEDLTVFLNFENTAVEFFSQLSPEKVLRYKVSYDYRIRRTDGEYIRILHQLVAIQTGENGSVLRTLGIHTDISEFKTDCKPILSFIDLDNKESFINVKPQTTFTPSKATLTPREKEILKALIDGYPSKQIAGLFNITKETVDRHRKNMLAKTGVKSSAELVGKAIREGWL